jgi:poly-gamma-glutamate synthesis protein (capsule biosynthesis protein)
MRARVHAMAALLVLASCDEPAPEGPPARPTVEPERADAPEPVILWIGGDVLPSGPFRRAMQAVGDPADALAEVLAPTMNAMGEGFVLVNMEAPVAREVRVDNDAFLADKQGPRRVPTPLNAPAFFVEGLARAGIDAVMLANNHTLDQTREGLGETIDQAMAAGLIVTGAGRAPDLSWPIIVGDDDASMAVLTYFERDLPEPELEPGVPGVSVLGEHAVADVRRQADHHEAVVVVIHVVYELRTRVKPEWRRWASELVGAGADAVILHGQHVPTTVETIEAPDGRRAVVAYGLGNFISDMGSRARPERAVPEEPEKWDLPQTREALVARVELADGEVHTSFLPVFVSSTSYLVYNRVLEGPPRYSLIPFSGCGPATELPPEWPEPFRSDIREWHDERRDHLLRAAGLTDAPCRPGSPHPLRP